MSDPIVIVQLIQNRVGVIKQVTGSVSIALQGPQGPPGSPGASSARAYLSKNADYYVNLTTDGFIEVSCDSGDVTIYLPESTVGNKGLDIVIKKMDSNAYKVIVATLLGQQIDDSITTFWITDQFESSSFTSAGSGYSTS